MRGQSISCALLAGGVGPSTGMGTVVRGFGRTTFLEDQRGVGRPEPRPTAPARFRWHGTFIALRLPSSSPCLPLSSVLPSLHVPRVFPPPPPRSSLVLAPVRASLICVWSVARAFGGASKSTKAALVPQSRRWPTPQTQFRRDGKSFRRIGIVSLRIRIEFPYDGVVSRRIGKASRRIGIEFRRDGNQFCCMVSSSRRVGSVLRRDGASPLAVVGMGGERWGAEGDGWGIGRRASR